MDKKQVALHLTDKQKRRAERVAKLLGVSRDQYIAALIDEDYVDSEEVLQRLEEAKKQIMPGKR